MKSALKKTIQKSMAVLLIAVTVLGCMDIGNTTAYADVGDKGMIYSYDGNVEIVKDVSGGTHVNNRENNLEHGKPVTVIEEKMDESGKLWYQVEYKTNKGTQTKKGYCLAVNVRLDKDAVVTATAICNADAPLMDVTGKNEYTQYQIGTIPKDTKLYITDNDSHSDIMYRVRCDINGVTVVGWIQGTYIAKDAIPDIPTDGNYEQELINKGFPASYAKSLAILHEQYPNWQFVPVQTGLDWAAVIAEEAKGDRNLVEKSANDAKKSTTIENYDWYNNTWMLKDSGRWVSASVDYIAYCMDPRNYLDDKNIFMFEDLDSGVGLDAEGVETITKGTFMENNITDTDGTTLDYADAFVKVGMEKSVSAYHLAARVRLEQGEDGDSSLISGTYAGYEGYFNYFNIGATGKNNAQVLQNGIIKAKDQRWDTRYKSLLGGAAFLKDKYINLGQDTLYFQKFNVVYEKGLYNHQYMQNVDAASSEAKIMAKAHVDLNKALVFEIPVYLNMPETAVEFNASGNPNNYLSALSISGVSLSPSFDGAKTEYSAIVDASVNSVSVTAKAVASTSKITGADTYELVEGNNTIKVTCTAQNGDEKVYTITIAREKAEADTSVTKGDINGDGKITIADLVLLNRHILAINTLTGEQLKAADVNGNGSVNIQDLVLVNRHILGISSID